LGGKHTSIEFEGTTQTTNYTVLLFGSLYFEYYITKISEKLCYMLH